MMFDNRFRAGCALVAASAAMALAGCGGGGNNNSGKSNAQKTTSYKQNALKVAQTFKNDADNASQQVQSASTKNGKVQGLESLKAAVNKAATGFSKLDPPDNAKQSNTELVNEFHSLSGDVDSVETAIKTNDASKAQAALPKLQSDQSKIQQTLQNLKQEIGS